MKFKIENVEQLDAWVSSYETGYNLGTVYRNMPQGECLKSPSGRMTFVHRADGEISDTYVHPRLDGSLPNVKENLGRAFIQGVYDSHCKILNARTFKIGEFVSQYVSTSFRKG